jgi:hypothetical protein
MTKPSGYNDPMAGRNPAFPLSGEQIHSLSCSFSMRAGLRGRGAPIFDRSVHLWGIVLGTGLIFRHRFHGVNFTVSVLLIRCREDASPMPYIQPQRATVGQFRAHRHRVSSHIHSHLTFPSYRSLPLLPRSCAASMRQGVNSLGYFEDS